MQENVLLCNKKVSQSSCLNCTACGFWPMGLFANEQLKIHIPAHVYGPFSWFFYFCPSYEHNQGDEVDVDRYKSLLKETFRSMIYSL